MSSVPIIFSSALTMAAFVLVVVLAPFNSWHFSFTLFKSLQIFSVDDRLTALSHAYTA